MAMSSKKSFKCLSEAHFKHIKSFNLAIHYSHKSALNRTAPLLTFQT